ncbi:MAG: tRNA preQ1(34) S-adenosylmethionine ribosyltransferase-isomerase QueA [Fimbriimonadales bacterium]
MSFLDFELPEDRIAQTPLEDRAASKLLVVDSEGRIRDAVFRELPGLLEPGDLVVWNDTRVSARRLLGRKRSGGRVELLVLRRTAPDLWDCLVRPARRLPAGAEIILDCGASVVVETLLEGGRRLVRLHDASAADAVLAAGQVPLPPYIQVDLRDPERYQTVFASKEGSAAAPTAGLHFTQDVLEALRRRGIEGARVTLDVSLDTFRPMAADDAWEHPMHGERCEVPPETVEAVRRARGRILAVGTTTVRTLESMAVGPRVLKAGSTETRLFIRPGYKFLVVDGIVTNFHMPRTTMLLMISAFLGASPLRVAYEHALAQNYRFLSFGDAMLALRTDGKRQGKGDGRGEMLL